MAEVIRLGEFDGIQIYSDPSMEENNVLVGRKSKEVIPPGPIFVPKEIWEEGLRTMQARTHEDLDKTDLRSRRTYNDIKFIVGGTSEIERYQHFLTLLKSQLTDAA